MANEMRTEITADILKTLYGIDIETVKTAADAPDTLFPHRIDMTLGFKKEDEPDRISLIHMNIPFGRVSCTPAEWQALLDRLASEVSEKCGFKCVPCPYGEILDMFERQVKAEELAKMEKFLKTMPKEGMYSA